MSISGLDLKCKLESYGFNHSVKINSPLFRSCSVVFEESEKIMTHGYKFMCEFHKLMN